MKRLRLVFGLVAIGLLAPLFLLIEQAVRSVDAEREAHHAAVATRLADEMERALSVLLRDEEARSHEDYRFDARSTVPGTINGDERPAYVLGYFEVDARRGIRTPRHDGGVYDTGPDSADRDTMVRRAATALINDGSQVDARWGQVASIAPGSTVSNVLGGGSLGTLGRRGEALGEVVVGKRSLADLNRGNISRSGRASKKGWADPRAPGDADQAAGERPVAGDGRPLDVTLEPMTAKLMGDDALALMRVVRVGGGTHRQGLLISVSRLADWLVERIITGTAVAPYVGIELLSAGRRSKRIRLGPLTYTHRFAEPFDGLAVRITLEALPDAVEPTPVYALAFGLALLAPLGLLALYRMTAVQVRFAERRTDFVSAVTHELKTPLTSIRMYGEMLREGMVLDEAKRQTYYTHITAEGERLSRLVENVLELARLEKGTRSMSPTAGDPGAALRQVAALFGPQARAAGFTIEVDAPDDLPAVIFERDALVQVLFNLVDNAVKYAGEAEDRRIILGARAAGGEVLLTVRDHGPGVPDRQLRKVFEPFYRAQREMTRTAQGTGIGLALVRGLMDRMGGRVTGRNAPGGGFEVQLALPVG